MMLWFHFTVSVVTAAVCSAVGEYVAGAIFWACGTLLFWEEWRR